MRKYILALGVLALIGIAWAFSNLWIVRVRDDYLSRVLSDKNHVRAIMAALRQEYRTMPPASDGRVDVYRLVRDDHLPLQAAVAMFRSSRSGIGPSQAEILDGDYTRFPYVRALVRPGIDVGNHPILWDPRGDPRMDGLVLVGYSAGEIRHVSEAEARQLNGG